VGGVKEKLAGLRKTRERKSKNHLVGKGIKTGSPIAEKGSHCQGQFNVTTTRCAGEKKNSQGWAVETDALGGGTICTKRGLTNAKKPG